jgi:hypothetical protein
VLTIFCKEYQSTRTVCFRSWCCRQHVPALAHRLLGHAHYKKILFSAMIWVILLSTITLLEHKVVTHTSWIGLKGHHHMQKRVTRSLIVKVFWTFSSSSFFFFSFLQRVNTVEKFVHTVDTVKMKLSRLNNNTVKKKYVEKKSSMVKRQCKKMITL